MTCFAPEDIEEFNEHIRRNKDIFVRALQLPSSLHRNLMVMIVREKQRDKAAGIRDDDLLSTRLHISSHRSARTNPQAPSPVTFPQAWLAVAMPRLLSHRLRFGTHVIPRLTTPVSLQPHVSSHALLEA